MNHLILLQAIEKYGKRNQLIVSCEEMSELQKELCKALRGDFRAENIAEEMADVEIMLEQLKLIFQNTEAVREQVKYKVDRLQQRLDLTEQE